MTRLIPAPRPADSAPFGRVITAMITPFAADGSLDLVGAQQLATHLVDSGTDGLVINGTTGEAPTTTDTEKETLLRAVLEAVGDRAKVVAGAGTNDTAHTIELAHAAQRAGAHGVLVVTPYYSKPPQAGLLAHFTAVADAVELPVVLYDIPGRSGVPIEQETLVRLGEHRNIVAVKDATGDFGKASWVLARTSLVHYSGDDMFTLPFLAIGSAGVVSVVSHVVAGRLAAMIAAFRAGESGKANAIHTELLPVFTGMFRTQGVITAKAALAAQGLPAGPVRAPLVEATDAERATLRADLAAGGVNLEPTTTAGVSA